MKTITTIRIPGTETLKIILSLVIILLAMTVTVSAGNNLLLNPGFENGTIGSPDNWVKYYPGTQASPFSYPEPGRIGGSSAAINFTVADSKEADWVQSVVGISSANTYKFSGWIQTQNVNGTGGVTIKVDWYTSSWIYISSSSLVYQKRGTIGWAYFEKYITNVPSNAVNSHITLQLINATGKAWFDDIYFAVDTTTSAISSLSNNSGQTYINWTWINPTVNFNYTGIYINGAFITNISNNYYNLSGLQPSSIWTISTQTVSKSGAVNTTWVNQTTMTAAIQNPAISLSKTANRTNYSNVGDTIKYTYNITNTGNVQLNGPFNITDNQTGTISPCSSGSLSPSQSMQCTSNYIVTQSDVAAGSITNIATANTTFNTNVVVSNQASLTILIYVQQLSIKNSLPTTDPTTIVGNSQTFELDLNKTANVTWYINGSIVQTNTSVTSATYTSSTSVLGTYNITASATDGNSFVSRTWNWTITDNLLLNPGFESVSTNNPNMPANWITYYIGTQASPFSYPEPGRIGGYSVATYFTVADPKEADWVQPIHGINSSNTYILSGWFKIQNIISDEVTAHIDWSDSNGAYIDTTTIGPLGQGTLGWTYFELYLTNVPSNAVEADVVLKMVGTTGKIWFDDIYFAATTANVPTQLSITNSLPTTDPTTIVGNSQTFELDINKTANITWYINGSIVQTNTSVTSATYTNSTANIGIYNVTASATDGNSVVSKTWNWTINPQPIPTYNIRGTVFDNYGTGLGNVLAQNGSYHSTTSASGFYSITNLPNGTYNFSYSKSGFNTDYLVVTIDGADNNSANITIYDTTPPGQVTGLANDTPTQTTVNLSWNSIIGANYYQIFRNGTSLGYTKNAYWHDINLVAGKLYQYNVRANDTYNNWGLNSTTLSITTAMATNPIVKLLNPGFENGTISSPDNWVKYYPGTQASPFSYPEPGRIGGSSAAINFTVADSKEADWVQSVVGISSVNTYKFSGWIQTQNVNGTGGVTIKVDWYTSSWIYISSSSLVSQKRGTIGWIYFEKNITNVPSNAVNSHITLQSINVSGKAWFDDMSFNQN